MRIQEKSKLHKNISMQLMRNYTSAIRKKTIRSHGTAALEKDMLLSLQWFNIAEIWHQEALVGEG